MVQDIESGETVHLNHSTFKNCQRDFSSSSSYSSWSLLYSANLRSRADSLRSHVILNE